jgi:hypothetical protein
MSQKTIEVLLQFLMPWITNNGGINPFTTKTFQKTPASSTLTASEIIFKMASSNSSSHSTSQSIPIPSTVILPVYSEVITPGNVTAEISKYSLRKGSNPVIYAGVLLTISGLIAGCVMLFIKWKCKKSKVQPANEKPIKNKEMPVLNEALEPHDNHLSRSVTSLSGFDDWFHRGRENFGNKDPISSRNLELRWDLEADVQVLITKDKAIGQKQIQEIRNNN